MRVLVAVGSYTDGCAWYRSMGPWSAIAKQFKGFEPFYTNGPPLWSDVRAADLVFMQRPCTVEMQTAAEACKDFGVPLWVDWDDDILSIPRDNPAYDVYFTLFDTITDIIKMADLVTTSTVSLAASFSKLNHNTKIVPNAVDDDLLKLHPTTGEPNKMVMWRGTATHDRDVGHVASQIVSVANAHPDWTFAFMGDDPCPWAVSEKLPNVARITGRMSPMTFFKTLCILRPMIVMAPLFDDQFNQAKSNIAALEGALAGAAVVAPDWIEWRMRGVCRYIGEEQFGNVLSFVMDNPEYRESAARGLWGAVQEAGLLSHANDLRMKLAIGLVGK